jgi:hypothetical protein
MQIRSMLSGRLTVAIVAGTILGAYALTQTTSAFNPQPDPPGFGLVSLVSGQGLRLNVVCSEHGTFGFPPDPCRGQVMFHDVAGATLAIEAIELRPGEAKSIEYPLVRTGVGPVGINPCWIPAAGSRGHAIPSAEVFSLETGGTLLYMNPAAPRLSFFETLRPR